MEIVIRYYGYNAACVTDLTKDLKYGVTGQIAYKNTLHLKMKQTKCKNVF